MGDENPARVRQPHSPNQSYIKGTTVLWSTLLLIGVAFGCGEGARTPVLTPPASPAPLRLTLAGVVTSGLINPLDLQHAGDDTARLFIVEQPGTIRIFQRGTLLGTPFFDIRSKIEWGGEKGLLGLAFHPRYRENGRFFVDYTRRVGGQLQSVIAEYHASAGNPDVADPAETVLLVVNQPYDNHNGGQLAFGPDGFLYISLGDGGSGGDPQRHGQNINSLLGKILRLDVDSSRPYAIPPDNPFVNHDGADEIWAYGLRNVWRFSFDRGTGRLFAADVGQNTYEEIDLIIRGGNYGWNIMEGAHCYPPSSASCNTTNLILPINEYGHDEGISVTGGYVYRGSQISQLRGTYVFGDYGSGKIWGLRETSANTWERTLLLDTDLNISSFGEDEPGEIYVIDLNGGVYRLQQAAP